MRILIVDDNETNRDILKTRLAVHGYDLLEAGDGEEALAVVKEQHPDLVLLDVMMPKLDGIEVCRRLKADPSLPFMAVILVTAKADTRDVVAGLEAGADEYLAKPVDQLALVARVKSVLRLRRGTTASCALPTWRPELTWKRVATSSGAERVGRLRFHQIAESFPSGNDQTRESCCEIAAGCDLRGSPHFRNGRAGGRHGGVGMNASTRL